MAAQREQEALKRKELRSAEVRSKVFYLVWTCLCPRLELSFSLVRLFDFIAFVNMLLAQVHTHTQRLRMQTHTNTHTINWRVDFTFKKVMHLFIYKEYLS